MENTPTTAAARLSILKGCESSPLDLIIIGGGITGAGILHDAARRGLKTLLIDQNNFASGTSSYSSKLIHGGLRYLENGHLHLVYESLRERKLLLENAPHLVKPLQFLYPVYAQHRRSLPLVAVGTFLYHGLTLFQSNLPGPKLRLKKATLDFQPALNADQLKGSLSYFDAITDDTHLTLATLKSGCIQGALACNYAEPQQFIEENGQVIGLHVKDLLTHEGYRLRARWVVNATGPWSDLTRANLMPDSRDKLRGTKGIHILLKDRGIKQAILMISPQDQRVTFALPWMNQLLIGTTDTDYVGNPRDAHAEQADINYLIETFNTYFPTLKITPQDVLSSFAGVRPLISEDKENPSSISREHVIFSDRPGFVSIIGGKLTSYRLMAEQTLDWIYKNTPEWKSRFMAASTRHATLVDEPRKNLDDFFDRT